MRTFEMPFITTRGALEQTLLSLGYSPKHGKNDFGFPYVEYRNADKNALVELREAAPTDLLDPNDLLVAEHSVEWSGIADATSFYQLLREKTPQEVLVA